MRTLSVSVAGSLCVFLVYILLEAKDPVDAQDRGGAEGLVELRLQSRDTTTAEVYIAKTKIDPTKTGIVVIDMWNHHWCKTATQRVAVLVPRMNHCLEAARNMGMQVFLCPTDAVDQYVGTP